MSRIKEAKVFFTRSALGLGRRLEMVKFSGLIRENKRRAGVTRRVLNIFYQGLDSLGGAIDLGTKKEAVPWAQMPAPLGDIFSPEFDSHPEEITGFGITRLSSSDSRFQGLSLTLYRQNQWWSRVDFVVRDGGGTVDHYSFQPQDQVREALAAASKLNNTLWMRDEDIKPFLKAGHLHSQNSLKLTIDFLEFASSMIRTNEQSGGFSKPKKGKMNAVTIFLEITKHPID